MTVDQALQLAFQHQEAGRVAEAQAICRQIQLVCYDQVPIIPIGIYYKSTAYSNSLTGMLDGFPLFTNIRRG